MPVTVTFRLNEEDKAHEIPLDELKGRITSGEIGPAALVRDRVLTNGEWWSLDNLNLFHTHSPVYHEAGVYLKRKQRIEDEKQYAEEVRSKWAQKVITSLPESFIDDCLGFEPLDKLLARQRAAGVLRLVRHPAFGGIDGVTVIFGEKHATILTATAAKNPRTKLTSPIIEWVNSEIPDWGLLAKTFSTDEVKRRERHLSFRSLRQPLNDWSAAKAVVQNAPDCVVPMFDGITYFHAGADQEWTTKANWSNPRHDLTPAQAKLVDAYKALF